MPIELPTPIRHFVIACVIFELVSLSSELAGLGAGMRNTLVALGGFWPGLFTGAPSFFPGQEIVMFGTSAVLHGSPIHLGMNMFGLIWLGPMVVDRLGHQGFWPLAGLSALGAGVCYTLLSTANVPMVGASGVLYGLLGAVAVWLVLDHRARGQSLGPYAIHGAVLLGLNVLLTVPSGSQIAWQAHLGGFLAGAACGVLTWRGSSRGF